MGNEDMQAVYLGIDVGAVSVSGALVDEELRVARTTYRRTLGRPAEAVAQALADLDQERDRDDSRTARADSRTSRWEIRGAGVTGSGRHLAAELCGADVVKNEITAHYVGARHAVPNVATIIDIGGQDSKVIIVRDGVVVDFAMNTLCGAGTGSFLDQQAVRLGIPIEEFGKVALRSRNPVEIKGGCGIFAEREAIHYQQEGARVEDIAAGLCRAVAQSFLRTVARGRELCEPIVFEGGVAANAGVREALSGLLGARVVVPHSHEAVGAIGAAMLARERMARAREATRFRRVSGAAPRAVGA
jgi:predicted CoA-substrate-specific enzyme activase